jgi:hypothetical protein
MIVHYRIEGSKLAGNLLGDPSERFAPNEFTLSQLRNLYTAALGHSVSATNLQRVLVRRAVIEPTGGQRASGPTGGRPGAGYRFRRRRLEITDQFGVLRPPGPASAATS